MFGRRQAEAGAVGAPIVVSEPTAEEALTRMQLAELQAAWEELTQAAEGKGVTSFHAYTRNGKPWEEDPAAVRALAATLRDIRAEDTIPGTQPAR